MNQYQRTEADEFLRMFRILKAGLPLGVSSYARPSPCSSHQISPKYTCHRQLIPESYPLLPGNFDLQHSYFLRSLLSFVKLDPVIILQVALAFISVTNYHCARYIVSGSFASATVKILPVRVYFVLFSPRILSIWNTYRNGWAKPANPN